MTVRRAVLLTILGIVAVIAVLLIRDWLGRHADTSSQAQSSSDSSTRDLERAMTFTQPAEPTK